MNLYKSMTEALAAADKKGFTHSFKVEDDGIHCLETHDVLKPEEITIVDYHRFEGSSDPDDMAVVYLIESKKGLRGTMVDAYGAYSESDVLQKLKIKKGI